MSCPTATTAGVVPDPSALAEALEEGGLPECCRIEVARDRLWLLFPESDFAVRTERAGGSGGMRVVIAVAVRAPAPSLDTWWDKWSVSTDGRDPAAVVRSEILGVRDHYLRMLRDRFGDRIS